MKFDTTQQWCTHTAFHRASHIVYRLLAFFSHTHAPLQLILMRQEAQRKPKHVPKRPQCFFQRASVTKCRVHITQPDDLQPCITKYLPSYLLLQQSTSCYLTFWKLTRFRLVFFCLLHALCKKKNNPPPVTHMQIAGPRKCMKHIHSLKQVSCVHTNQGLIYSWFSVNLYRKSWHDNDVLVFLLNI